MTVTTRTSGRFWGLYHKQLPEIDLLVEEQDLITMDLRQYEPFVTDPPILKVNKHKLRVSQATPSHLSAPSRALSHSLDVQLNSPPLDEPSTTSENLSFSLNWLYKEDGKSHLSKST
jgi:hypothetical protein